MKLTSLSHVTFAAMLLAGAVACDTTSGSTTGSEASNITASESAPAEVAPVVSREFKVLLDAAQFAGDPSAALAALEADVLQLVGTRLDRPVEGSLSQLDKERTVQFLDTAGDCQLRSRGYVFRERVEDGEREVTLKFRSDDRYLAAAADVSPSVDDNFKTKLEEDKKPPYVSVFSHSTKVEVANDANFGAIADTVALFPGLAGLGLDGARELAVVSDLTVHERGYGELEVDLGEQTAEMGVALWYAGEAADTPSVAELSFKYKSKKEAYAPASVQRAKILFEGMQGLSAWVATASQTKTSFVYDAQPGFCGGAAD